MGSHPANLALRFALELAALAGMAIWGWQQGLGVTHYAVAVGAPVIAASLWATFAVPNDPSRSGSAPVAVGGVLRLGIEFMLFAFGVWGLYAAGRVGASIILAATIVVHYVLSHDRVSWLLTTETRPNKLLERARDK